MAGTPLWSPAGLVGHLHTFFAMFGVPDELTSDGGPEITALPYRVSFAYGVLNIAYPLSASHGWMEEQRLQWKPLSIS